MHEVEVVPKMDGQLDGVRFRSLLLLISMQNLSMQLPCLDGVMLEGDQLIVVDNGVVTRISSLGVAMLSSSLHCEPPLQWRRCGSVSPALIPFCS